jgi:hypothetical protein
MLVSDELKFFCNTTSAIAVHSILSAGSRTVVVSSFLDSIRGSQCMEVICECALRTQLAALPKRRAFRLPLVILLFADQVVAHWRHDQRGA